MTGASAEETARLIGETGGEAAPYAVVAQIKTEISPRGVTQDADLARVVGILRESGYRGFVALEYEAKEDPFVAVPRYLTELRQLISAGS